MLLFHAMFRPLSDFLDIDIEVMLAFATSMPHRADYFAVGAL